jgi:hypothetical protein
MSRDEFLAWCRGLDREAASERSIVRLGSEPPERKRCRHDMNTAWGMLMTLGVSPTVRVSKRATRRDG